MLKRLLVFFAVVAVPGASVAACSGAVGTVIPTTSTETYTLGDGSTVACKDLLIVDKTMLEAAKSDSSYDFKPSDSYTTHSGSTYDFSEIYTGNVTDMSEMFWSRSSFNQDISKWDTSSVTNMSRMFLFNEPFNQDISKWDTSSVTDMSEMFSFAKAFNQDISRWDTSSVNDMSWMFEIAHAFNQDLSKWDTSSVIDMTGMFDDALAFNGNISSWDVSNVQNFRAMFYRAEAFNQDLSAWNVANGWYFGDMFSAASAFNQDLTSWNVCNARTWGNFGVVAANRPKFGDTTLCSGSNAGTSGSAQAPSQSHANLNQAAAKAVGMAMAGSVSRTVSGRLANGFQSQLSGLGNMLQSNAGRVEGDMASTAEEALFLALREGGLTDANGWVNVSSDDLLALHEKQQDQWFSHATASLDGPFLGARNDQVPVQDPIDVYTSFSGGRFYNDNAGSYTGYGYSLTSGVDYVARDKFLLGTALGYESAHLEFDNALDGQVDRKGWRIDLYSGLRFDLFSYDALVSYGRFNNDITSAGETGSAKSGRMIGAARINAHIPIEQLELAPYLSLDFLTEEIDAYTTSGGSSVAKTEASTLATAGGIRVSTPHSPILGLSNFASYEFKLYWEGTDAITLASGAILDPQDYSSTFSYGISGAAQDIFGVDWMDNAQVDFSLNATNPMSRERSYMVSGGLRWAL